MLKATINLMFTSGLLLTSVATATTAVMYDPRIPAVKQTFTPADQARIDALWSSLPTSFRNRWKNSCQTSSGLQPLLALQGAFTKVNASERVDLVDRCGAGGDFMHYFLLVSGAQKTQVIRMDIDFYCGLDEGFSLRDINLNGLKEVGLVIGCGDGGAASAFFNAFQLGPTLKLLFATGAKSFTPDNNEAWVLTVNKSATPSVVAQRLIQSSDGASWRETRSFQHVQSDPKIAPKFSRVY